MPTFRERLAYRCARQVAFARDYSPLYAALFATVGAWCEKRPSDPVVRWLVEAGRGRSAFDVGLLLLAGLHRDVLLGEAAVADLAAFYPSVGGQRAPQTAVGQVDPALAAALHAAILARREPLAAFIRTATVQTNETGRGLIWLLPLTLARYRPLHLVDLGASAGLNLVAERRAFRLTTTAAATPSIDLGQGEPPQFQVACQLGPETEEVRQQLGAISSLTGVPTLLSRSGCDLHPFRLETAVDEQTLASFIWADQVVRLQRLREGIAAFKAAQQSAVPVRLYPAALPGSLRPFLDTALAPDGHPVLLYNTYITMYLAERGAGLRREVVRWAEQQRRPVLWLQWEPPQHLGLDEGAAPELGWLAWTADLWHAGTHRQWLLGWTHPHGQRMRLLPGMAQLARRLA